MNQITTFERLQKILIDFTGLRPSEIKLTTHFEDDLGYDSLDMEELIIAIEDEFELEFIGSEIRERVITVEDAVFLIDNAEKVESLNV